MRDMQHFILHKFEMVIILPKYKHCLLWQCHKVFEHVLGHTQASRNPGKEMEAV